MFLVNFKIKYMFYHYTMKQMRNTFLRAGNSHKINNRLEHLWHRGSITSHLHIM